MTRVTSEAITTFLRRNVDEYLRSVIHYDQESFELLYMREDVAEQYIPREIEEVVDELRWGSIEKSYQEGLYVHGHLRCTVRCFSDGVEMHFPHDVRSGTAIAFDPEAATQLYSFIGECLNHFDD